jgi:hypothetical protein
MAIKTVTNPVDDSEMTLVEGVIEQLSVKELANDKFDNTHKFGIRIGDDWVNNVNVKTKEGIQPQIRINTGSKVSPKWESVDVGDTVRIIVTPSEYNGKTYYNSATSKIKLLEKGQGAPAQAQRAPQTSQGGSSNTYAKKDDTPIVAGNARTAAAAWMSRFDGVEMKEAIKFFAEVSHKARLAVKEANPSMSDFEVGVATGQATVIAAQLCDDLDEVFDFIIEFVNDIVPFSVDVVKSLNAPKQEVKAPVKKVAAKKATAKKEATPEQVDDVYIPDSAFDDDPDGVPF